MTLGTYPLATIVRPRDAALSANIVVEPRIYYDAFRFPGDGKTLVQAYQGSFRNGEGFPLCFTHIISAMRAEQQPLVVPQPPLGDERMIQRYSMRIERFGEYYQAEQHAVIPLWANVAVAAGDAISQGSSSWRFPQPLLMSNEDTFVVEVVLEKLAAVQVTRQVEVAFHGYGMESKQPYTLPGRVQIDAYGVVTIDADLYRNYGQEPLIIEEMTIFVGGVETESSPAGDIRAARINVKRVGSGTNGWWAKSANNQIASHMPAQLFGATQGRSVVHQLPEGGWYLTPNQGVTIEVTNADPEIYASDRDETVLVALAGYAFVPSEVAR